METPYTVIDYEAKKEVGGEKERRGRENAHILEPEVRIKSLAGCP